MQEREARKCRSGNSRSEGPCAYTYFKHKTAPVIRIRQIQRIAITDVDGCLRKDVYPQAPDAVDWIARPESRVCGACSRKHQPIVFGHELNAFCGKNDKPGAHMDLIGLRQIPRAAGPRIPCDFVPEVPYSGNPVVEIAADRDADQIV